MRTIAKIPAVSRWNSKSTSMKQVRDDIWRKKVRKMRRVLLKNAFLIPLSNCQWRLFTGGIVEKCLTSHTHWRSLYSHKHASRLAFVLFLWLGLSAKSHLADSRAIARRIYVLLNQATRWSGRMNPLHQSSSTGLGLGAY